MGAKVLSEFSQYPEAFKLPYGTGQKVLGGGPEQRRGGSSVFEPLVRGGSCKFSATHRGGGVILFFFYGNWHTFDTI